MADSEQLVCISCVSEVRYSFVSHLSEALRRKGISSVIIDVDSDDLLSKESQAKIEISRVSVMVLSRICEPTRVCQNFVNVIECQRNKNQVVVPVLYGESPLLGEWLSVLDLRDFSPVHQSRKECSDSQLVKEIVRDVYEKLFYKGRIGIYSKLLEIEKMVCKQPLGIRCVGIWGMPGIGKTTLAKAVFDQMSGEFDAYCFIEDYSKAIQEKGVYCLLEEQFLKENAGGAGGTVTKLSLLRDKLNNKRVLVVLGDVCSPLVVESFLGGFDWFGPKSLIIITSRDKSVFRLCRVNQIYEVHGLNEKEALQLFSMCASIDDMAEQNLHEVSMKVIKYANGHPLALSLYGRELKGKKRPPEMETAFLQLKERPPNIFVDAIKSCYDTLNDREKDIFLDIACFFQGENVDYVMQVLEGCGFFPHVGIDVLVEKCLVTISENRMRMHNLIQDVGRHIINRETRQTKRRDRLWEPWSIKYLLEDNGEKENGEHKTTLERAQGPEEIEGMFLDTSNFSFDIKPAAFDNMLNLRLLKIYSSNPEVHHVKNFLKGFLNSLPNELRLLHWENYPLQFLPQNFDPIHLVEINMPYSQLKKLWGGTKNLEMLKTIRLCHSQQLVDIDDVLKAQNLEVIDLQGCTRLQSFPATGQLLHLRIVNLSGCTEIKSFPEIPPNIETLNLQGTGIIELPLSIIKPNYTELLNLLAEIPGLSGVSNLEQSDLKPLTSLMKMSTSNQNLGKLICLELKDCARLRSLPNMNNLELLKVLDLSGCSELETIQGFPQNLKELYLAGTAVRQVPQLPQSLELFNAHGCVSLKSIRVDFEKLPVHYTLSNCFDLCPKVVSDFLVQALANAKRIPREHQQELNKTLAFSFCAPSHANQNSKLDLQPGSSVMTRLNYSWRNTLVGFAILVEVAFSEAYSEATGFGISCVCRWKNKEGHSHRIERNLHCWDLGKAFQKDHMFVFFDVNMRPGTDEGSEPDIWADLVVFEFFPVNNKTKPLDDSCTVTRCGVRVITAVNCNTSIENISPVFSLDPMEVSGNEGEEVLRVSYDGLQEIDKALFLYIACFFNDEDVGLVAPLIANIIDMDVSYGLKVLADRSLIHVSSNGEIVMHYLQRGMGKEILYTESKKTDRLVDNIQTSMIDPKEIEIRFPSGGQHPETSAAAAYFSWPTSSRLNDSAEDRANYFANLQKGVLPETFDGLPTGKKATTLLELMMIRAFHSKNLRRFSLGTAIGFRIRRGVLTNIAAILVFVARKVHKQWLNPLQCLPTALEGPGGVWCDVDVVEFQYYGAPAQTPKEQVYTELVDDLRGSGSSIGSGSQVASQETYGTLGAIVKSKTGIRQVGFLTNRHIAVDLDYPSQKMFHPLPPSLGPGVYLGAVERATSFITDDLWYGIFAGTNPETFVRADGAFIPFAEDFNMNNVTTTVKGIGEIGNIHATDLQSPINSLIGRKVVKVGRSSGLTTGTIMAYALEYNDEKGICFLTDFLVVGENQQTFDLEGDSGSLILLAAGDEKNEKPRPVGIIWGGTANRGRLKLKVGEQPENWTSGVDLGRVLNLLELDLITSNEGLQAAVLEQRNGIMCAGIDSTVVESSPGQPLSA